MRLTQAWYASLLTACTLTQACGKKKADAVTTTDTPPTIAFTFPSSSMALTDSLNLATTSGTNVLSEWANRSDRAVKYINTVLEKLGSDRLQKKGAVHFTTAAGAKVSVTLGETSGTYSKTGTICVDAKPSLYIEWNADNSAVHAVRDFNVDAWAQSTTALTTDLTYAKTATGETLTIYSYGKPWNVPTDVAADTTDGGSYLGEVVVSARPSDGTFTMKGVNAWEDTVRTSSSTAAFTGDAYLTGKLASDGSGNFVAWRRFNTLCASTTFADTATTDPGWCFTGAVGVGGTVSYAIDTTTQWTTANLASIGIASDSTVKFVSFPPTVTCPAT